MKDRVFYSICLGIMLGVLVRSFVLVNIYFVALVGILAVFVILFYSFFTKNKWSVIIGVFVLSVSLGIFRFNIADKPNPTVFESQVGQKVILEGRVVDEADVREFNQKLTIEARIGDDSTSPRLLGAKGTVKILTSVGLAENVKYGDEVSFSGKLEKPENFITDQGKEFDYINYLRKDGILYLMNYANIDVISSGNGNTLKSALFSIKEKFLSKINFSIPSPESLLMGGLILGEKSNFSSELRQQFIDTGTIHIVALSGYNVTIVAEWLMKLFKFLPHVLGIWVGILAILLFVLMTGGGSTAVRAGVMATLALIARATGRNYDVARALILAGVGMIIFNPFLLVYDVSFQLSFIATVAVIFLAPRIEKYFMWVTEKGELRDIITVTSAAYIFVLPFILYKMGNLSLVALPANVLILPFIPFTMGLGFATGLLGMIWYGLSVPLGFISYLFLHYELSVIGLLSRIPFAALIIPDFSIWLTILIYIYFLYRLFGRSVKKFVTEEF